MKTSKSGLKPLPTLTQVVIPAPVQPVQPVQDNNTYPSVDSVLQQIMPSVEERIRTLVEQVLLEHRSDLTSRLRSDIEMILGEIRVSQDAQSAAGNAAVSVTNQLFDPSKR